MILKSKQTLYDKQKKPHRICDKITQHHSHYDTQRKITEPKIHKIPQYQYDMQKQPHCQYDTQKQLHSPYDKQRKSHCK